MISGLIARFRSLFRGVRNDVDTDMQTEFAHHLELRTRDLVKSGMSPEEAVRRARVEFGGTYNYKERGREARGLRWFDALRISWLDIKLGARMVYRYPGLTVIGGLAMGVAIALGAGVMGAIALLKDPKIPLDEGDRIVGIQVWHIQANDPERRLAYDLGIWKSELKLVQNVGAFRGVARAVGANDGRAEPARGAEMSASGFRVARVNPLLGRYLVDEDERAGAALVVVLGYDVWSGRFGSDSSIVGRTVKVGGTDHTVVGVMPEGFAWPVNQNLWLPLRIDPVTAKPRQGPVIYAFGRLAPGVSLEEAATEVAAIGERTAKQNPETHARIRPRLMPFAQSWFELDSPDTILAYRAAQVAVTLLLVIICVNIAILVYARTATRQGEIAVRTALGASRGRIIAQLVGEALVLATFGAVVGLGLIAIVVAQTDSILAQTGASGFIPFWMKIAVSPETIGYLITLAMIAALIIGVFPALQVTGRRVQANLKRLSGGNASVRMGKLWTSLIVAEVAFTVAILPTAAFFAQKSLEAMMTGPGFPAEQYLTAELGVTREENEGSGSPEGNRAFAERATQLRDEVMLRLLAEPEVASVTYSAELMGSESSVPVELDNAPVKFVEKTSDPSIQHGWGNHRLRARMADVGHGFFEAFDVTPIVGRTFRASDLAPNTIAAVVNRTFADSILRGGNPIGRKFRLLAYGDKGGEYRGPWQEIVGVVPDFPAHVDYERPQAVWYSPTRHVQPALLSIRMRGGDPSTFAARLRAITSEVDQSMFIRRVQPLSEALWETHLPLRLMTLGLIVVAASVLVLSTAGLYALMSVVVTQRRREIGIRIALGADRRRVLSGIFSRAAIQVGSGVALGIAIAIVVFVTGGGELRGFNVMVIMPAVALFMLGVGTLAALGPARRGLAIQPSAVLKED